MKIRSTIALAASLLTVVLLLAAGYGGYCFSVFGRCEAVVRNTGSVPIRNLRFDLGRSDRTLLTVLTLAPHEQRRMVFYPNCDGAYRLSFTDRDGQAKQLSCGYVTAGHSEYTEWQVDAGQPEVLEKDAPGNYLFPFRPKPAKWRESIIPTEYVTQETPHL